MQNHSEFDPRKYRRIEDMPSSEKPNFAPHTQGGFVRDSVRDLIETLVFDATTWGERHIADPDYDFEQDPRVQGSLADKMEEEKVRMDAMHERLPVINQRFSDSHEIITAALKRSRAAREKVGEGKEPLPVILNQLLDKEYPTEQALMIDLDIVNYLLWLNFIKKDITLSQAVSTIDIYKYLVSPAACLRLPEREPDALFVARVADQDREYGVSRGFDTVISRIDHGDNPQGPYKVILEAHQK